ncbi:N-acetyltransferase family protein [Tropicimonas sp. S265A]|uniref:GNAT family N-acetyltransferase n=1 Tax=Tropicimonas sp. S265A TaxID=3415134 RepID=UPI003C7AF494
MQDHIFRDATRADIPWLVARHDALYRAEAGFDGSFAGVVERALNDFFDGRDPKSERAFIPVVASKSVGSLFCTRGPEKHIAQIRLFWLEPAQRGTGLGRAMLEAALQHARAAGMHQMLVRTYDRHAAAGRLYAKAGFELTEARAVENFGQSLVEQAWRRAV